MLVKFSWQEFESTLADNPTVISSKKLLLSAVPLLCSETERIRSYAVWIWISSKSFVLLNSLCDVYVTIESVNGSLLGSVAVSVIDFVIFIYRDGLVRLQRVFRYIRIVT